MLPPYHLTEVCSIPWSWDDTTTVTTANDEVCNIPWCWDDTTTATTEKDEVGTVGEEDDANKEQITVAHGKGCDFVPGTISIQYRIDNKKE